MIDLRLGDCLKVMGSIPDGSIDLVLADPPYGTTACKWDVIIPFEPLWAHYRRLLKPRGAVVLTASQPFTSMLVMSNPEWFKYCWVWRKSLPTGHFNAKNKPLKVHEDVCVFSPGTTANCSPRRMTYNPQGLMLPTRKKNQFAIRDGATHARRPSHVKTYEYSAENYPVSVLDVNNSDHANIVHPTQKPVALMEYLIRTYSNEGDTVLDNAMGSGTTGLACLNTGRHFIGIESDPAYFAIAQRRLAAASNQTPLFAG